MVLDTRRRRRPWAKKEGWKRTAVSGNSDGLSVDDTSLVVDLRGDGSHGRDRLVQTTAFDYDCDRPGASRDKELIVALESSR